MHTESFHNTWLSILASFDEKPTDYDDEVIDFTFRSFRLKNRLKPTDVSSYTRKKKKKKKHVYTYCL